MRSMIWRRMPWMPWVQHHPRPNQARAVEEASFTASNNEERRLPSKVDGNGQKPGDICQKTLFAENFIGPDTCFAESEHCVPDSFPEV
eukprot:2181181-Amphidinium_carterae.1